MNQKPSPAVEMHAIAHGRVQGVFFRDTTRAYAQQLQLTGTVKNLPDGTVEIYAQGPREQLDHLLNRLQTHAGMAHVDSFTTTYTEPIHTYTSFQVIF